MHDVIIIGGGPAGLSAAAALSRLMNTWSSRIMLCTNGPSHRRTYDPQTVSD